MDITAKTKEHAPVTVKKDIPTDLAGLTKAFGEDAVASAAHRSFVISAQAFVRSHIDDDPKELQKKLDEWKPGVSTRGPRKSAFDKALEAASSMSQEEKKALLAKLTGKA